PTAPYVTASVGISVVRPKVGRSPEGVVQLADESLYSAKRSGRNCVKLVDSDYALFTTGTFRRRALFRLADAGCVQEILHLVAVRPRKLQLVASFERQEVLTVHVRAQAF